MGRYYHLSKKLSKEEIQEVESKMNALENVKSAEITKDSDYLKVDTVDGQFEDVMRAAVNICSQTAHGTELSFARFAYED
jgi:hypothetical protein